MNKTPDPAPLVHFTLVPKGTLIKPDAALTIEQAFAPYALQFQELSASLSAITDPKEAKVARLKLRKVRTDTDKKHQEMKAESLNYGRALDTAKNLINAEIQPLEEKLRAIEEAEERRLAQIIADRKRQHLAALAPYLDPAVPAPFVDGITDDQFAAMLDNAKLLHQAKIDRQKREEAERLEREAAEAERRRLEQAELDRLREEALQRDEMLRQQREEQERLRLEQEERHRKEQEKKDAEAKRIKDEADAAAKKAKDAADAKLKKERAAADAKLAEERRQREAAEEQARIEREAREKERREAEAAENARKEDEARRLREQQEAAERAAAAPDKEKLLVYAAALKMVPEPTATSRKGKAMVAAIISDVHDLLENIRSQAAKL